MLPPGEVTVLARHRGLRSSVVPMTTMPAIGSFTGLPIDHPDALQDVQIAIPELRPHDVLVGVHAVSVNPVDIKRRGALSPSATAVVLGFDAAGVVEAVGREVS